MPSSKRAPEKVLDRAASATVSAPLSSSSPISRSQHSAEVFVESDDENPDPQVLAQFLGAKTDFATPLPTQRGQMWQEKTLSMRRANRSLGHVSDLLQPSQDQVMIWLEGLFLACNQGA